MHNKNFDYILREKNILLREEIVKTVDIPVMKEENL